MIKKIFFWDGNLDTMPPLVRAALEEKQSGHRIIFTELSAGSGVSACTDALEWYQISSKKYYVLTNYLQALNSDWFGRDVILAQGGLIKELFYLWDGTKRDWVPIEELTDKELRYAHNLAKIYLAGGFNKK